VKLTPHLSSAEIKNEWSNTSTSPICPRGMDKDNLKFVYPAKTFAIYTCRGNRVTVIYLVPCKMQNYCRMCHVYQS
jgi:hypothetical protein